MESNTIVRVRVFGDYACFSRPEMKVERMSYDVMTPSAARGVLDAILWKPQMRWVVRRIEVLNPIQFTSFRRNEVTEKILPGNLKRWMQDVNSTSYLVAGAGGQHYTQRNTVALEKVDYIIEAEPLVYDPSEHPRKYAESLMRRVSKGQCFHRPYFGCREFPVSFCVPDGTEQPLSLTADLGLMLYDIAFSEEEGQNKAIFFNARLDNGVLDTLPSRVIPKQQEEVMQCSSRH